MAQVRELSQYNPDGTRLGQSTADKLGFFGLTTPIVQPSGASQGTVTKTTTTTSTTTALTVDIDAVRVLANKLRSDLVALGLIKGAA